MSQYDAKIIYVKGKDNMVVDALSRLPSQPTTNDAENTARHPYDYCPDDIVIPNTIAHLFCPELN